jgi:hypothetical protein
MKRGLALGLVAIASCQGPPPAEETIRAVLMQDRILRLYGNEGTREGASSELAAFGEAAVPALKNVLQGCSASADFGARWPVWDAAASALIRIQGPAKGLSTCLPSAMALEDKTLKLLIEALEDRGKDERASVIEIVQREMEGKEPKRLILALEVAGAIWRSDFDAQSIAPRFRALIQQESSRQAAAFAWRELDSVQRKFLPGGVDVFGEMLRHREQMVRALRFIGDNYGTRDLARFLPILREIFIAYLTVHNEIGWTGGPYFLLKWIIEGLRDHLDQVDPGSLLSDSSLPLNARKNLVEFLAVAAGEAPKTELEHYNTIEGFDAPKIKAIVARKMDHISEKELRDWMAKWFPSLKPH